MNKEDYWYEIPRYPKYKISKFGEIISLKTNKILSASPNSDGYPQVRLFNEFGKCQYKVHKLMAFVFLNHKSTYQNKGIVVDHIDNNRKNNNLYNLRLVTPRENRIKSSHINNNKTSKYIGVCYDKNRDKWFSSIKINGKQYNLGRYSTQEEASEAYQKKLIEINDK
jgi:hypothetical protein